VAGSESGIKLVVFDWAGTTVDHGCFAPVQPFVEALRRSGVEITAAQARGPMGLEKRDHLRALLSLPDARAQWRAVHGSGVTDSDIERIFTGDFVPLQLASVASSSTLIDGLLVCIEALRVLGIKIGTTTGYFAEAAELCYEAAAKQGYAPDCNVNPGDVTTGRPAPWMIFRNMELLGVYPPTAVVKVGDTLPDISEGLNAGCWSVGVSATGSEVALHAYELAALAPDDRAEHIERARKTLADGGAHYVIESVRDLPELLDEIESRVRRGEVPPPRPAS
jgi:phosphonoacetaldehyde hydrolase